MTDAATTNAHPCPSCGQTVIVATPSPGAPVRCRACGAPFIPGAAPAPREPTDLNATQVCGISPEELMNATQKATPQVPGPVAAALRLLNPKTLNLSDPERRKRMEQGLSDLSGFIREYLPVPARQWDVGWAYAVRARLLVGLDRGGEIHGDLLEAHGRRAELTAQEILELTRYCVAQRNESAPALGLYKKFMPYLLEHAAEFPGGEPALWEFFVRLASDVSGPNQVERAELSSGLLECRPQSSVAHFLVGLRLHLGQRHEQAMNFLRRAEERMREDVGLPAVWKGRIAQTLGRVQVALGRHEEARNSFERSLSHDPQQYEAYRDYVLLEVHVLRKVPAEELAHPRYRARLERARKNLEAAEANLTRQTATLGADLVAAQRRKLSVAGNELERMLGAG